MREHDAGNLLSSDPGGGREVHGEATHLLDGCRGVLVKRREIRVGGRTGREKLRAELSEGIDRLPSLQFLARPVGSGVAGRVAALTVGENIEEDGALARFEHGKLSTEGVDHCQRVVAVHGLGMEVPPVQTGREGGQTLEAHGLAAGLAAHPVEVIHDGEDDGQSATIFRLPERPELAHGGEVQCFPHRSATERGISDVGDGDPRPAPGPLVEGRPRGDVGAAPDDGVVGVHAKRGEEGVHGASQTPVEPGRATEDLGQEAVEQILNCQGIDAGRGLPLDHSQDGAAEVLLHDPQQVRLAQSVDRTEPFGDDLAMAPMAAVDVALDAEEERLAHGRGLLADG